MVLGIWEADIGAASTGEFGIEFEDVADIADDKERGTSDVRGQVFYVASGLVVGALKGNVPAVGAALAMADAFDGDILIGALLGFHDEAPCLVQINESCACDAVTADAGDGLIEDIGVYGGIAGGGFGALDAEDVTEFGQENLVIGAFGRGGFLPS